MYHFLTLVISVKRAKICNSIIWHLNCLDFNCEISFAEVLLWVLLRVFLLVVLHCGVELNKMSVNIRKRCDCKA